MNIKIDRSACIGSMACVLAAPEIFVIDDEGCACLRRSPIPAELQARARIAVKECPVEAIKILEN